jgi:hypothetical protein
MFNAALRSRLLAHASAMAMVAALSAAAPASANNGHDDDGTDSYMAGDFHNHTTCTDGTVSIETMITKSIKTFDLEWLASADHGGTGTRDCRINDPEFDSSRTGEGKLWEETIGAAAIKGDVVLSNLATPNPPATHRAMWRWQMIEEFVFPEVARLAKKFRNPMLYAGLETNVPGHEHTSSTVLGEQRAFNFHGDVGNASALAEFEYRFDRSDTDRSGKGGTPGVPESGIWKGKVVNAAGAGSGILNHKNKAVPSVAWMQTNFPLDSYYVPAHVERAGVFDPNGNRGFNVEHFRDFNNAGPTVAVGFETMPGHQASNTRGEYQANFGGPGIDSVGVTTYGGVGIYGAKIGGLWDAMLGEGRNWFFYASSDWHNRGRFSPFDRESTQDFYPGEYQKLYIPRPEHDSRLRPQHVVNSVRHGNSFSLSGDLITGDLRFTAEIEDAGHGRDDDRHGRDNDHGDRDHDRHDAKEVRMGETLVVPRGKSVRFTLTVTVPKDANNSPYSFNNPSLLQLGIRQPLNRPVLDHVDFIRGNIDGVIAPTDPNYTNATNPSAHIHAVFDKHNWKASGRKRTMSFVIRNIQGNQYVRARGTNLPPLTPNETDSQGNPLSDLPTSVIPCTDPACPAHMQVNAIGSKMSSFDVAAWSDLWFYTNPIFIRVADQPKLLVETNGELARKIATSR